MKSPQTNAAPPEPLDIGDVRRQIDEIDGELAALIARRCGLSANVAAAKKAAGDTAFGWRPAREVEILRTIMRQQASLDPTLAFCVWRALISANLAAQGDLTLVTIDGLEAAAKIAFSAGTTPIVAASAKDVLAAVARNDHAIGVLPWPSDNDWWVAMMEPKFAALHVCAASPMAGGAPEVMLIAARAPEAAGEDISIILGPIGAFDGGVMARSGKFELVAYGEFIGTGTPLPESCRLIGSFALA
jgi:chorismate mutase